MSTTIPRFIGSDDYEQYDVSVGEVYFLVRFAPQDGAEQWTLQDHPQRTNMSHAPMLFGWCGNTNNVCVDAHGLARVDAILKNGRTRISAVDPDSEAGQEALENMGWPELAA